MTWELDCTPEDLALFVSEAAEALDAIEESLLGLEQTSGDAEMMQRLFRAAHTLKGNSASLGYRPMAALTHAMESVLDDIRGGKLALSPAIANAMFRGLDRLKVMHDSLAAGTPETSEDTALVAELEALRTSEPQLGLAAPGSPPVSDPGDEHEGLERVEILVRLDPGCELRGVRAWQVLRSIVDDGVWISSNPTLDSPPDAFADTTISGVWIGELPQAEIRQRLEAIDDVTDVELTFVTPQDTRTAVEPDVETRRLLDLGPAARGLEPVDQMRLAAKRVEKLNKAVRVDVDRLDSLMNLTGELFIERSRISRAATELGNRHPGDSAAQMLEEASHRLLRLTDQLQAEMMKIRMLPISTVVGKLPRVVRDLAQQLGKQVEFTMDGTETELDRSIIESISDPLTHLIRNAIDHGIELGDDRLKSGKPAAGQVRLEAAQRDGGVVISVIDDGRGIDPQRIAESALRKGLIDAATARAMSPQQMLDLIFLPGLSTAAKVTDISGRGVGMDIVRTTIEKAGGSVSVQSTAGHGSVFMIRLPLTLAVAEALLVEVQQTTFAIPLDAISEALRVESSAVRNANGQLITRVRDRLLTLLDLRDLFFNVVPADTDGSLHVISVRVGEGSFGLVVDRLIGHEAIVVKGLSERTTAFPGVSGATILGDGGVGLIIDVNTLVRGRQAPPVLAA